MEEILRNSLPIFANLTDSFVALTNKDGIRLKVIDANGNSIASLENRKLSVAERAIRERKVISAPSELSRDSKLWAIPIGEYALVVTEDGKKQQQQQLEYSLKESLHVIADVLGSEAALFDEIGKITHSVNRDGSRNDQAIGQINQDAYSAMALFKSQVLESSMIPGGKSILLPITRQVGLEISNLPSSQANAGSKKERGAARYSFDDLIGSSDRFQRVKDYGRKAAGSPSSVLLLGETGTGKELFAQAIHNASPRAKRRFIPINCGALPANLIESILFGYETGTFTGGSPGGKKGLIAEADQGTLFLDEIGEMDLQLQTRLLRVLQEKEVMSLGGSRSIEVDIRVIAATNKNLKQLVAEGKFREDLYYRLNVLQIQLPSLRERREDLDELINSFIKEFNLLLDKRITGCSEDALDVLRSYDWPGNVRQLRNCMERAAHELDGGELKREHLPEYVQGQEQALTVEASSKPWNLKPGEKLEDLINDFERTLIEAVLQQVNGNRPEAARRLGISSTTLWRKLNQHQLDL